MAPSANPAGKPPAQTIAQATAYFGDAAKLYVDDGTVPDDQAPSTVVLVPDSGEIEIIR